MHTNIAEIFHFLKRGSLAFIDRRASPRGTLCMADDDAAVLAKCRSAASLLADPRHTYKLKTGCTMLDVCLGGGISANGITEVSNFRRVRHAWYHDVLSASPCCFQITGESASGKTQLCLQLLVQVRGSSHTVCANSTLAEMAAFYPSNAIVFVVLCCNV